MGEKHLIKTAFTNDLADDEHKMFETCRRHEELNQNVNLKNCVFCWFSLQNLSQSTVQKHEVHLN